MEDDILKETNGDIIQSKQLFHIFIHSIMVLIKPPSSVKYIYTVFSIVVTKVVFNATFQ